MSDDTTSSWDFSHVFDLVNSLSSITDLPHVTPLEKRPIQPSPTKKVVKDHQKDNIEESIGLGNFSRLWEYLGAPKDAPTPIVSTGEAFDFTRLPGREDYASDGAIDRYSTKEVKWKDLTDDYDASQTVEESEGAKNHTATSKQERNRRKKQRRKERAESERLNTVRAISDLDSETERRAAKGAPAKKASVHLLNNAPQTPDATHGYNLRPRTSNGNVNVKNFESNSEDIRPASTQVHRSNSAVGDDNYSAFPNSAVAPIQQHANNRRSAAEQLNQELQQRWKQPLPKPGFQTVKISQPTLHPTPASVLPYPNSSLPRASPRRKTIQPLTLRTGEDRYWALILKLIADFPLDRRTLVSPSLLVNHSSHPAGIHVFVDASNIFIGFHDQLKRARGIPLGARVPRVDLSFGSLALLLERRRPVAKRVLAGSTPAVPAFEEAARIGYEMNVLDKVHKAKELTARQKFFEAAAAKSPAAAAGHRGQRGTTPRHRRQQQSQDTSDQFSDIDGDRDGDGDDEDRPSLPAAKWVEQGVDEILHLKICETLLDYPTPGTIVLATGDAAEAEYSQGFLRQVERALEKGWSVELVSWSKNISAAWRKRSWTESWGPGKFRVIELDTYAEELLEM
ncbi:MAG: hypothetical protein Q9165_006751 [Trypethelium subeluteriae]